MKTLMTRLQGQVIAMDSRVLAQAMGASSESDFWSHWTAERERFEAVPQNVAVMHLVGPLWHEEYAGATHVLGMLGPSIDTLVLHIDSPGGAVSGLWDFCDAVYAQRGQRDVVALCEGMAASAGYAIASQAQAVVCGQGDILGSIGVRASHFDYSAMLKNDGVKVTELTFGDQKNDGTPFAPLSGEAKARMQGEIDAAGEKFLNIVARGRGDKLNVEAARATQAGVYVGQDAINAGLADQLASVADFVTAISAN